MTDSERAAIIERSGIRSDLVDSIQREGDGAVITYRSYYGLGDEYALLVYYLPPEKRIGVTA